MGFRKMPWLWKHPKTAIYWFRRATPRDLTMARGRLEAFGIKVPREALKTLGTRDPVEAEALASEENRRVMARWDSWRKLLADGPRKVTQREAWAMSGEWAAELLAAHEDNPGDRRTWETYLRFYTGYQKAGKAGYERAFDYMGVQVDAFLKRRGIVADEASRKMLKRCFLDDFVRACGNLIAMADGDYSKPDWLKGRPKIDDDMEEGSAVSYSSSSSIPGSGSEVTFEQLVAGWQRERDPKHDSVEAYEKRIKSFAKSLGHQVASRVTREDAQRWKRELLAAVEKPNAKGINLKIDAAHTLFAVAINNGVLKGENPFKGLRIREKRGKKARARRDFSDTEARAILKATRGMAGFLRWAPWLMAYSGMRVGEVGQLRRSDVAGRGDRWAVAISGEAGTVKTEAGERIIPLHSAIVREGFPAFVAACGTGRLFPELYRKDAAANTPRMISRRGQDAMRRWIRGKLGIVDLKVAPDHSWRHWFHTRCRDFGVDLERRKAIVGHAPGDVGGAYGDNLVEAMRRELEKIEPLDLEADDNNQDTDE